MLQGDLTEKVIVTLLDQIVVDARDERGTADLQAAVRLLDDRVARSGAERRVLERFLFSPMDAVAQDNFRQWLRGELSDEDFRSRLVAVLAPLSEWHAMLPVSSVVPQQPGQVDQPSDRRAAVPSQREAVPRWMIVVASSVVLGGLVLWSQGLTNHPASQPSSKGPGTLIQVTGGLGPQTSTAHLAPQVQVTAGPVASFTAPGPFGAKARGTVLLGTPISAARTIDRHAFGTPPCSTIDPADAMAVPFAITLGLDSGSPYGTVTLITNLTWSQGTPQPAEDHHPVQITATPDGAQCDATRVEGFPAGWSAEHDYPNMGGGQHQQLEGWFVFPSTTTVSTQHADLIGMATYDLSISIALPGGASALSSYGPRVCRGNLVQIAGPLNVLNQCGMFPTSTG